MMLFPFSKAVYDSIRLPSESLFARGYVPAPTNTGASTKVGVAAYLFTDGPFLTGIPKDVVKRVVAIRLLKAKVGKYIMSFTIGKYITAHASILNERVWRAE